MKSFLLKRVKKNLVIGFSYKAGRNFLGRKTIYTQGGGNFKKVFTVDWKRNLLYRFKLISIQKDLNRKGFLGLICYEVGLFCYILLSDIKYDYDFLYKGFICNKKFLKKGNSSFLMNIDLGNFVHHIELRKGNGAQLVRAIGGKAIMLGFNLEKKESLVKMPSGWLVKLSSFCIGLLGNVNKQKIVLKNAGDKRNLGFRPRVRGVAMNPCDHPHGGGEGKKTKLKAPKSPWGKLVNSSTKAWKTQKKKKFLLKKKEKK